MGGRVGVVLKFKRRWLIYGAEKQVSQEQNLRYLVVTREMFCALGSVTE